MGRGGGFMKAFQISPLPIGLLPDAYKILADKRGRRYLGDPGADGRTVLKRVLRNMGAMWIGFVWLRMGSSGGFL
jgi:hypothetical protein